MQLRDGPLGGGGGVRTAGGAVKRPVTDWYLALGSLLAQRSTRVYPGRSWLSWACRGLSVGVVRSAFR